GLGKHIRPPAWMARCCGKKDVVIAGCGDRRGSGVRSEGVLPPPTVQTPSRLGTPGYVKRIARSYAVSRYLPFHLSRS
ncbi:MAG: hypothetical protein ACE5LB_15045, partial [Acidiferrobacterales bacterium]